MARSILHKFRVDTYLKLRFVHCRLAYSGASSSPSRRETMAAPITVDVIGVTGKTSRDIVDSLLSSPILAIDQQPPLKTQVSAQPPQQVPTTAPSPSPTAQPQAPPSNTP